MNSPSMQNVRQRPLLTAARPPTLSARHRDSARALHARGPARISLPDPEHVARQPVAGDRPSSAASASAWSPTSTTSAASRARSCAPSMAVSPCRSTRRVRKKDKLAAKLTWLANRHELNLPEDRRHDRATPKVSGDHGDPAGRPRIPRAASSTFRCPGAALAIEVKPPIGSPVMVGKLRAKRRAPLRRRHRRRIRDPADGKLARAEPRLVRQIRKRCRRPPSGRPFLRLGAAPVWLPNSCLQRINSIQFDLYFDFALYLHFMLK